MNHFARKTSPLQRELMAQWLREPGNEEQYYEWLEEWENRSPQYIAQTDKALQHYMAFVTANPLSEPAADETPVLPIPVRWRNGWLIAASIVCILGLGTWLLRDPLLYRRYKTAFGETRSIRLNDGSAVLLSANSMLRVPRWGFGDETREVQLTGEANFSVTHTPSDQKFVVKTTNNVDVIVLGTDFSVFARKRGARVVLNKGKVQVQYREGAAARRVLMKPGDLITLDPQHRLRRRTVGSHPPQPVLGQQKRFVFDETTLQEVAYMLEENYGLQVTIKEQALAERVLMGSFRADNVDQLLQSISELLDVNIARQGDQVQITEQ